MIKATVLDAAVCFQHHALVTPLVLSTGTIEQLTEAEARVYVQVNGGQATGRGSIYLSDVWAWPDAALGHEQRDAALRRLCQSIAHDLGRLCGNQPHHPLELGLRLHKSVCKDDAAEGEAGVNDGHPPVLARAMCLSPFDAAIHDAVGQALGVSAFDLYGDDVDIPRADPLFSGGVCSAVRNMLRRPPRRTLPAWWVVGKADDLERTLLPAVHQCGFRCFKLKIMGTDSDADAFRTALVYQAAKAAGASDIQLTIDSNEANPDTASVLDYLRRLESLDSEAYGALAYLEQPTGRNIIEHAFDWHEVTQRKPVLLDEGLTSLELLPVAREQGWSGLALKTCKGHSFAMVAAAWAHEQGMLLSLQDLTNPGLSAIHAALMGAFLLTINGVELNSPQFTPAANRPWLPHLASLFEPSGGQHQVPKPVPTGLGGGLPRASQ